MSTTPTTPTTGDEPVEKSWIRDQQAAGWPDWHPETYCHRCGRRNISSWYTDSAVWNEVHGGSGPIWCPICFVLAHEEVTGREQSWRLAPADMSDEVGALTRSEAAMRHERDRLRGELTGLRTAADDAVAATARVDRLEEQLATARADALRQAADRLMADGPVYRAGQHERGAIAGLLRRWADERAAGELEVPTDG